MRTDSQIANYGDFFRDLGKKVFAVYDKQNDATQKAQIEAAVDKFLVVRHCIPQQTTDTPAIPHPPGIEAQVKSANDQRCNREDAR